MLVFVFVANIITNSIFFNPHKDSLKTEKVHVFLHTMLSPRISNMDYLSSNQSGFLNFSNWKYQIDIRENILKDSERKTVKYSFGNARVDKETASEISQGVKKQSFYLTKADGNGNLNSIDKEKTYLAYLGVQNQSLSELAEKYMKYLTPGIENKIKWVAVKTSENADDVAVGVVGNNAAYTSMYFSSINYNIIETLHSFLTDSLSTCIENQRQVNSLLKSGMYGEDINIDFQQKLDYVKQNDLQPIGMVVRMRGDAILEILKNDSNLFLIQSEILPYNHD